MRQIEFNFTNTSIRFDVVDAPVADAWWDQLKLKQSMESINPSITMEPDFPRFRNIEECNNSIIENVNLIKQYGFEFDWPADVNEITQEHLNYLHQSFHSKEEQHKHQLPQQAHDILQLINQFVHQMEQIMWSETGNPTNYVVLDFGTLATELKIQRPIELHEREWFQEKHYEQQNNTCLLLGYATLGKHLGHCVWTNDTDVVKDGMLRPQQHIYTQVLFKNEPNFAIKSQQEINNNRQYTLKNQQQWIDNNGLNQYVDKNDPVHIYNTAPVVAFVNKKHKNFSEQTWFELWTQQELTGIKLHE